MRTSSGALAENKALASIRGIAALWVVGHHWLAKSSSTWVQSVFGEGHRAVDIFFVLSGFILTLVHSELRLGALPRFMAQRVFRLYPLHMASLLFLAIVFQLPGFYAPAFLTPGFAGSMLLMQPFFELGTTVNPAAWSIGIEMVFYLLFPLVLLALHRVERFKFQKTVLAFILLVLLDAQLNQMRTNYGSHFGMDAFQRGIYSFVIGMVLAKCHPLVTLSAAKATAIEVLACIAICIAFAVQKTFVIPSLAAMLIFSLSYDVGAVAIALRQRVLLWLGHISFSVYLLHYPIQVALDKFGVFEALGAGDTLHKLLRLATLLVVLLIVSTLAYRFIETPMRRIPARFSTWRQSRALHQRQVPGYKVLATLAGALSPFGRPAIDNKRLRAYSEASSSSF